MNNNLTPEPRVDRIGRVITRWVKPNEQGGSGRAVMPAPTTGNKSQSERSRGFFEQVLDSVVGLLMGPEDGSEKDRETREVLKERLSALPERTTRNLNDSWKKAIAWADQRLETTEFGRFSERVRDNVESFLAYDPNNPEARNEAAEKIDRFSDRMNHRVDRETVVQEVPKKAPSVTPEPVFVPETEDVLIPEQVHDPSDPFAPASEYSPLEEFFTYVEDDDNDEASYGTLDDLMNNGRTRRHH